MSVIIICLVVGILYLILIMPRMKGPDNSVFLGYDYAHRGLHDHKDAPENSLEAFRRAVSAGYGIELDVQLSRDGIPVVFHDETLKRVCGADGKIKDYTYEELQMFRLCGTQEQIPKLAEVLKLVSGRVPLIIEIKYHWKIADTCAAADRLLREYEGLYCIESFHPMVLIWYKKHRPQILRGQLSTHFFAANKNSEWYYFLLQHLLTNIVTKPDFIAYDRRYKDNISRILCRKLYKALSVAWTTRSQIEMNADKGDFDLMIFENFLPEKSSKPHKKLK